LGGKPRSFASHATPVFSPDSRLLAYIGAYGRRNSGHAGVAVADLRTHRVILRPKTFAAVDEHVAWSPDGTMLLVSARTPHARCDSLWIASVRSGLWRRFRSCS
jgi:Tol biopolymer transport system component